MDDGVALLGRAELAAMLADAAAAGARQALREHAATDQLLSLAEAARQLRVSVRAVRFWIDSGQLQGVTLPPTSATGTSKREARRLRVRATAIAAFLASCEQAEGEPDDVIDLGVQRALRGHR